MSFLLGKIVFAADAPVDGGTNLPALWQPPASAGRMPYTIPEVVGGIGREADLRQSCSYALIRADADRRGPNERLVCAPTSSALRRGLQGLDHQQVGSPDGLGMVGKEGAPALAGRSGWHAASVASDGTCTHGDAELEQLATNAVGTPMRVLARHRGDERLDLGVQARPSQRAARTPLPEQAPALAVAAQHGLKADQEEVASPVPVEAADDEPEELVPGAEAGPALATESGLERLAQEQVLGGAGCCGGRQQGWPAGARGVRSSGQDRAS